MTLFPYEARLCLRENWTDEGIDLIEATIVTKVLESRSLRDKLTDRGWVEHDDDLCRGEGVINKDYWSQDADDCPGCVEGLVPPDGMLEFVRQETMRGDRLTFSQSTIRAHLVAAARWEKE